MKCILISPSNSTVYGVAIPMPYPPLGMLYVAAVLEKEHKVDVYDYDVDIGNEKKLRDIIESEKPDIVGLTGTTANIPSAKHIAKTIKEVDDIPIFLGGIHATMDSEYCIAIKEFDFIIRGEAEYTVLNLTNHLENRKFEEVEGIWFKRNGEIIKNKDVDYIENLDALPFPARHLIKNPSAYVPPNAKRLPVTPMMTSRGCPARCTFCCTKNLMGLKFRFRSPENIVEEVRHCVEKYGVKEVHLMDDVFTIRKDRVLKIRDLMKESGLDVDFMTWGLRADQVDLDILQALKDLGVYSVGFGCESGNQQILDNIKKGLKLEKIREAYKMAKGLGFETWAYFIFGLPGDTKETIKNTIKFAKEIDPDFPKFHILTPYPNSDVYKELKEQNLIDVFDYEKYGIHKKPIYHLPNMSAEELVTWQKRAYRSFYLRPKKLWANIKRINSFTQLKLNLKAAMFILHQSGFIPSAKG